LSSLRYAMSVLWLLPLCCMKGFFLEPLCTCPLYLGASSGVPVYLASIVRFQFFSSCPCYIEGFFLELLVRMPTLFRGVQWSTYRSGPPSCDFLLAAPASCYIEGFFLKPLFVHARFILGRPVECLSVWPPSCDFFLATLFWAFSWVIIGLIPLSSVLQFVRAFFRMCFFKSCYLVTLGSTFFRRQCRSFLLGCLHRRPFKDKVYPLSILLGTYFAERF